MLWQRAYGFVPYLYLPVTVLLALLVRWWHHKRNSTSSIPRKWRCVGELSELTVFPIKSCAGISLQEAECTEYGIQMVSDGPLKLRDRFFIVYDERTEEFKTARTYPKMLLINMTLDGSNAVKLSAPNMPELQIKVPQDSENSKHTRCKIWNNEMVETVDCGDMAASWLSKYVLGRDCGVRLGYYLPDVMPRRVADEKLKQCFKTLENRDLGAYSDLTSFMLMTESSIADLGTRLPSHVSIMPRQFRPNFLVRGSAPYEEDKWKWIRIGNRAVFRYVKPCTRCVLTTINPDTAIMEPKREPLRTLKGYRILTDPAMLKVEGSSPAFGIHMGLHCSGTVRLGDSIFVEDEE